MGISLMARLNLPEQAELTNEQRTVCEEAIAGKRGKVPAPMVAWIRNPELARRGQTLGALLRFDTTLSARESELAILICGRHWLSHHEWSAHKKLALAAGLDATSINAIATGNAPDFDDQRMEIIYDVSISLLETRRIPDALYARGTQVLSERGLVELVSILGYYCLVSLTLNAFELGLPENVAPELCDPDFSASGSPQ
ncbi:carboxymuconolactone decarboxylase family protein [Sulfitobacter sp. EhC04]|uniref:carboxymuconolactone decarboxylase family protein n=1 Tax=Sulfitobacter sp. EhC04 TaxID=1849168 RepID=UPI001912EDD6|nr:carboxymuconolactone decarboxylase family protein [Sulfitobacter sp. EhC04]